MKRAARFGQALVVTAAGFHAQLRATLEADSAGTGVQLSFQPDSLIPIDAWPWHSYDFDFASLGSRRTGRNTNSNASAADTERRRPLPAFQNLEPTSVTFDSDQAVASSARTSSASAVFPCASRLSARPWSAQPFPGNFSRSSR